MLLQCYELTNHPCSCVQLREAVSNGCLPLRKLCMLLELLNSTMKQIVTLWESRQLQVCVSVCVNDSLQVIALYKLCSVRARLFASLAALLSSD